MLFSSSLMSKYCPSFYLLTPSDGRKVLLDCVVMSLGLTFRKRFEPLKLRKQLAELQTILRPRKLDLSATSTPTVLIS